MKLLCFVRQVEDSVARVKSSEEDVYYRNDSMKSVEEALLVFDRIFEGAGRRLTKSHEEKKKREKGRRWAEIYRIPTAKFAPRDYPD